MPVSSKDPFTQVYDSLWTLAESYVPLRTQIRERNLIRLDSNARDVRKDRVATADLPELTLVPTGTSIELHANSSQTRMTQEMAFSLSTGDQRIHELHFPLKFHIICSLTTWKESLGGLIWNDHVFVHDVSIPSTVEGESDPQRNRNIEGWVTILNISVAMEFPTTLLRSSNA